MWPFDRQPGLERTVDDRRQIVAHGAHRALDARLNDSSRAFTIREMERPTFLDLELRPAKPRPVGLTAALDGGLPLDEVRSIVDAHAAFLDLWKLGWGAYLDPQLDLKLELLRGDMRPAPAARCSRSPPSRTGPASASSGPPRAASRSSR